MENYYDEEGQEHEEKSSEEDTSTEEGFIEGYAKDEEVTECAECGGAVREDKKEVKEIEGETYTFCSKHCAKEFEETIG